MVTLKDLLASYFILFIIIFLTTDCSYAAQSADSVGVGYTVPLKPEINLLWSTLKVVTALGITLVILIGVVWIFKKILTVRSIPGFSDGAITVIEMRYIAPKKAVALVKVVQRVFIIGFSDQTLIALGELTADEREILDRNKQSVTGVGVFKNILAGFTGNKKTQPSHTAKDA